MQTPPGNGEVGWLLCCAQPYGLACIICLLIIRLQVFKQGVKRCGSNVVSHDFSRELGTLRKLDGFMQVTQRAGSWMR